MVSPGRTTIENHGDMIYGWPSIRKRGYSNGEPQSTDQPVRKLKALPVCLLKHCLLDRE